MLTFAYAEHTAGSRHSEAEIVAHIGEVDARRLYASEATPSMFVYCLERLHLSEHEAYLRIAAARAARGHPVILEMLADGRLHLTAIALLAPHLTPQSQDALLERATHKTKREVEEILAELVPRPDVRASIRKLPLGRIVASSTPEQRGSTASPPLRPEQVDSSPLDELVVAVNGTRLTPASGADVAASVSDAAPADGCEAGFARRWAASPNSQIARIEPLSSRRYKVQFTASAELRDKLERLKAWMRSSVPDGDLATVIEAAVTEKLERLEARRFGRVKSPGRGSRASGQGTEPPRSANGQHAEMEPARPADRETASLADRETVSPADAEVARPADSAPIRPAQVNVNIKTQPAPRSRHVPAEVRRAVYWRDQGRCRFVDDQGRRCTARSYLELHHGIPYAAGGEHSPGTMSLLCHAHNRLMAEVDSELKPLTAIIATALRSLRPGSSEWARLRWRNRRRLNRAMGGPTGQRPAGGSPLLARHAGEPASRASLPFACWRALRPPRRGSTTPAPAAP